MSKLRNENENNLTELTNCHRFFVILVVVTEFAFISCVHTAVFLMLIMLDCSFFCLNAQCECEFFYLVILLYIFL